MTEKLSFWKLIILFIVYTYFIVDNKNMNSDEDE